MRGLQHASASVLFLATQTHSAVARGDMTAANAARAALGQHLQTATHLIDVLLDDPAGSPLKH